MATPSKKDFGDGGVVRIRRRDDTVFTIEDARELLRAKKENATAGDDEQIIEQKRDIIAQQEKSPVQAKVGAASVADIFGFNPIQSKQTNRFDRDPEEIPLKYRKYYKLLLKMRDDVKKGLSKLTNDNLAMSVGTAKQAVADKEIESFDSEFAISLMASEQGVLTEIEEAIQRIYLGTYGICELTGKPIEPQRLKAVPFARFSLEGQVKQEKSRQSEVARGSVFQGDRSDEELAEFEPEEG
jgi:RNA polymerase-binding transcription factor DksA